MQRALHTTLASLVLSSALQADILILEQPQLGLFLDPQAAVNAASPGETLLFLRGDYAGFIVEQGLTLHAPNDDVLIQGTVSVRNLPAGESVRMNGLVVRGADGNTNEEGSDALDLMDCSGSVIASNCSFYGGDAGTLLDEGLTTRGGIGVSTQNVADLTLVACLAEGGLGGDWPNVAICCEGGPGGAGLSASQTSVALYDCQLEGGPGGDGGQFGARGGHGLRSTGPRILSSNSSFQGGRGGTAQDFLGSDGGDGGNGMVLTLAVQPFLIENEYAGGAGGNGALGSDGEPGMGVIQGGSVPQELLLRHRGLTGSSQGVAAGGPLDLTLHGRPGDQFYLAFSRADQVRQVDRPAGTWLVPRPQLLLQQPVATIPATGTIDVQALTPDLPSNQSHASWIVQAFVRTSTGKVRIGGALLFTTLDPQALPDCNANGAWDLLDIAQGGADADGDGLLDSCGPATLFVDASANPGGDGSSSAPFQSLAAAWNLIADGGSIFVAPGTYSGPENRLLDLDGRSITLEGSSSSEVDLRPGGSFLMVDNGATFGSLTLRNVSVRQATTTALFLPDSQCLLDSCDFLGNAPGGSTALLGPNSEVRDCFFAGNQSTGSFVKGSAIGAVVPLTLIRSTFDSNGSSAAASTGGAVYANPGSGGDLASGDVTISQCIFRDNTAASRGGALHLVPLQGNVLIEDCFFALNRLVGNTGISGGAVTVQGGNSVMVSGCTFVKNEALGGASGGAFALEVGIEPTVIQNSVLWDNLASQGSQISVIFGDLEIAYSDLQGGLAAIAAIDATLTAGAGLIDADPLFVNATVGDYRLGAGSPCIDAGDLTALHPDRFDIDGDGDKQEPTPLDLLGQPRFVDDPLTPDTGNGTPAIDLGALEAQP